MNEPFAALANLLSEAVLPNLKAVQQSQKEQIAANDRLESEIEELRAQFEMHFARLSAQLTTCQAELAVTQALLKAARSEGGPLSMESCGLIH